MVAVATDPLADLAGLEGVPSAVAAARDAVDAVLRDRGVRVVRAEQSVEALVTAARASAELATAEDEWCDDWLSIEGATVRLYTELVDLSHTIRVAPGQAIARAHAVFGRGVLDDAQLGRVQPDPAVAERMSGINQLLTRSTTAPGIVLAGVVHAEILSCRPFRHGSGVVARAIEHMILIQSGIDSRAVTLPEAGHRIAAAPQPPSSQDQGGSYRSALEQYRSGTADGARRWLLHVADAVTRGAELSPVNVCT